MEHERNVVTPNVLLAASNNLCVLWRALETATTHLPSTKFHLDQYAKYLRLGGEYMKNKIAKVVEESGGVAPSVSDDTYFPVPCNTGVRHRTGKYVKGEYVVSDTANSSKIPYCLDTLPLADSVSKDVAERNWYTQRFPNKYTKFWDLGSMALADPCKGVGKPLRLTIPGYASGYRFQTSTILQMTTDRIGFAKATCAMRRHLYSYAPPEGAEDPLFSSDPKETAQQSALLVRTDMMGNLDHAFKVVDRDGSLFKGMLTALAVSRKHKKVYACGAYAGSAGDDGSGDWFLAQFDMMKVLEDMDDTTRYDRIQMEAKYRLPRPSQKGTGSTYLDEDSRLSGILDDAGHSSKYPVVHCILSFEAISSRLWVHQDVAGKISDYAIPGYRINAGVDDADDCTYEDEAVSNGFWGPVDPSMNQLFKHARASPQGPSTAGRRRQLGSWRWQNLNKLETCQRGVPNFLAGDTRDLQLYGTDVAGFTFFEDELLGTYNVAVAECKTYAANPGGCRIRFHDISWYGTDPDEFECTEDTVTGKSSCSEIHWSYRYPDKESTYFSKAGFRAEGATCGGKGLTAMTSGLDKKVECDGGCELCYGPEFNAPAIHLLTRSGGDLFYDGAKAAAKKKAKNTCGKKTKTQIAVDEALAKKVGDAKKADAEWQERENLRAVQLNYWLEENELSSRASNTASKAQLERDAMRKELDELNEVRNKRSAEHKTSMETENKKNGFDPDEEVDEEEEKSRDEKLREKAKNSGKPLLEVLTRGMAYIACDDRPDASKVQQFAHTEFFGGKDKQWHPDKQAVERDGFNRQTHGGAERGAYGDRVDTDDANAKTACCVKGSSAISKDRGSFCCNSQDTRAEKEGDPGADDIAIVATELGAISVPTGINGLSHEDSLLMSHRSDSMYSSNVDNVNDDGSFKMDGSNEGTNHGGRDYSSEYFSIAFRGMAPDRIMDTLRTNSDPEDRIMDFRPPIMITGYTKHDDVIDMQVLGFSILGSGREILDSCKFKHYMWVGQAEKVGRRLGGQGEEDTNAAPSSPVLRHRHRAHRRLGFFDTTLVNDGDRGEKKRSSVFDKVENDICFPLSFDLLGGYQELCAHSPAEGLKRRTHTFSMVPRRPTLS